MQTPEPRVFPQPSPERASQIVDQLAKLLETLLERWMKTPASSFQEQALRSLLPQFVPSLLSELRKDPVATVAVLTFVHWSLTELLLDTGQLELGLEHLRQLIAPPNGTSST